MTDEALLLEGGGRPSRSNSSRPDTSSARRQPQAPGQGPSQSRPQPQERQNSFPKFTDSQPRLDPKSRLRKQAVEEESEQVYISPARRKKPAAKPIPAEPEPDLLFGDSKPSSQPSRVPEQPTRPQNKPPPSTSLPTRPAPVKRPIPSVSPSAISNSLRSRQAGTAAFKRGDYAEATTHYTTALGSLPSSHPLTIPLLTNRALSHLKTGNPKEAITDATTTLKFIGPSRGDGETIDLGGEEGVKPMQPYWGKAVMRKAEALEQLERWVEGAEAWRLCVEAGVGGATSITGRNRCQTASQPKPAVSAPAPRKVAPPRPKPSALGDLASDSQNSTEAVNRLRQANAAADKLDDEKFRLADIVDGRVKGWKTGKEANLRALLASLETVLWADAGWKKTGMAELIQPNRVKVVYMKGIAKVHPDKVSPSHSRSCVFDGFRHITPYTLYFNVIPTFRLERGSWSIWPFY